MEIDKLLKLIKLNKNLKLKNLKKDIFSLINY